MNAFQFSQARGNVRYNTKIINLVNLQNSSIINRTIRFHLVPTSLECQTERITFGTSISRFFSTNTGRDETLSQPEIPKTSSANESNNNQPLPGDSSNTTTQSAIESHKQDFPQSTVWSQVKYPLAFISFLYGTYATWTFYQSDYNLLKTRLKIELHHRQLWQWIIAGNEPGNPAFVNSEFKSCLSTELTYQTGVFFLQFDLDKENGVRRSDIVALIKQCGIENPETIGAVNRFIQSGRGRSIEVKRRSGCQLQEVIELFENLLLHEANNQLGDSFEDRLLKELTTQTKAANKSVVSLLNFQYMKDSQTDQTSEESEDEIVQFEIARLRRMRDDLIMLQSRVGLSPAQSDRLLSLERDIEKIELELQIKSNRSQIQKIEKSLK